MTSGIVVDHGRKGNSTVHTAARQNEKRSIPPTVMKPVKLPIEISEESFSRIQVMKTIETIPWGLLNHAYGTANDVPFLLDSLSSDDPQHRASAYFSLVGNVYHQGTRYSATYPACRVLTELIKRPDAPDKSRLLELIQVLSLDGCQRDDTPERKAVVDQLAWTLCEGEIQSSHENREHDWAIHDCYLLLTEMASELSDAANNMTDPRLAISAAYVLAFLPWHGQEYAERLMDIALEKDRDQLVRCSCLVSASRLSHKNAERAIDWYIRQPEGAGTSRCQPLDWFEVGLLSVAGKPLAKKIESLGQRYADFGAMTDSDLYPQPDPGSGSLENFRPDQIPPNFPWGDFSYQLRWLRGRDAGSSNAMAQQLAKHFKSDVREPFDPDRYTVIPGEFSQENVQQAVRRYHYNRLCEGVQLSEEHRLFEPFIPQVPELAWSTVLSLLDDAEERNRTCATNWCSILRGLLDEQIDDILDRVIDESRGDLIAILGHENLTRQHCLRLRDLIRDELLEPTIRSVCLDLWLGKADVDLLFDALETFPQTDHKTILRTLCVQGHVNGTDERLLKSMVADLSSASYGDRMYASMLIRRDASFLEGMFQHSNLLELDERVLLLQQLKNITFSPNSMEKEIRAACDQETNQHVKLQWLMLMGELNVANDALLDWMEAQSQAIDEMESNLRGHFQFAILRVMGGLFHGAAVPRRNEPSTKQSSQDTFERLFGWLRTRSFNGDAASRKQARRWILSHPDQEARAHALQVVEEGLRDSSMENRRDSLWSLYRVVGRDTDAVVQRLDGLESDFLTGDREMVIELAQG